LTEYNTPNMNKALVWFLLLGFVLTHPCLAQVSPSQIQRSQEILEKEQALRKRIEEEDRFFVETITLEGATLISNEEIKEFTLPYHNRWLTKEDIEEIIQLVKQSYEQKGHAQDTLKIDYRIDKENLIINIIEKPTDS